jgi:hypothetical protein
MERKNSDRSKERKRTKEWKRSRQGEGKRGNSKEKGKGNDPEEDKSGSNSSPREIASGHDAVRLVVFRSTLPPSLPYSPSFASPLQLSTHIPTFSPVLATLSLSPSCPPSHPSPTLASSSLPLSLTHHKDAQHSPGVGRHTLDPVNAHCASLPLSSLSYNPSSASYWPTPLADSPSPSRLFPQSQRKEWNDIRSQIRLKKKVKALQNSSIAAHSPSSPSSFPSAHSQSLPFTPISTPSSTIHSHAPPNHFHEAQFALSDKMEKWDCFEVGIFLSSIGMEKYQKVRKWILSKNSREFTLLFVKGIFQQSSVRRHSYHPG